jgi:hypothetical protein
MSSRSLAAARARRAGENAPPVSGNRPGTSIGSHAAFAPQMPPGYQTNMPPPPNNVRVARSQQNDYQQIPQPQIQQSQNGLPFSKLSISDAIGLITLRLGRIEQWVIETEHENENACMQNTNNLPDGARIIDNSILTTIINRIDSLEKGGTCEFSGNNSESTTKLSDDINKLNEHLAKIVEESNKHALTTAKHSEQLFRFERELIETKDVLKTFMLKYDMFTNEINEKLGDFEFAISEIEKNNQPLDNINDTENTNETDNDDTDKESANLQSIMSSDLKSMIKKELASENK